MERKDKYKCKYCNEWLIFYLDRYVCPICGLVYEEKPSSYWITDKNGKRIEIPTTYLTDKVE